MVTQPALEFRDLSHQVFVEGQEVYLTPTEYRLFKMFYESPGVAFSYPQIKGECFDIFAKDQNIRVWIGRLRRKMGPVFNLVTLQGWGYRYDA